MADDDNEVLDWENEDDEQQQGGDSKLGSPVGDDADDAVSLGDDDDLPSFLEDPQAKPPSVAETSDHNVDREPRERHPVSVTKSSISSWKDESSDNYENRQRSHKESPQRSLPRLTHALPPKPVVAAALAIPSSGRAASMKGTVARSSGGDNKSANGMSPESPIRSSSTKRDPLLEWEARVSSKGATYYYNRFNFESTWDKPASLVAPQSVSRHSSDDGRFGRHNVSTTGFRSSPTHSDMDSQDLLKIELEDSRRPPWNTQVPSVSDKDRHYRPVDSGYTERVSEGKQTDKNEDKYACDNFGRQRTAVSSGLAVQSRSRTRASSPSVEDRISYPRVREREERSTHIPEHNQRGRTGPTDPDSLEQKGRGYDDSRQPSRYPDINPRISPEDRTAPRPSFGRRQDSPRVSQTESLERKPVAAHRRRPASPSPPALLSPSHPVARGYDQRPLELRTSSNSQPSVAKSSRELPRFDRPDETHRKISTGPAPMEYGPRYTNPRSKVHNDRAYLEQWQADPVRVPERPVNEAYDHNYARDRPQGDEPEGSHTQQGLDNRDRRPERSRYAAQEELAPTSRIPERPRADRTSHTYPNSNGHVRVERPRGLEPDREYSRNDKREGPRGRLFTADSRQVEARYQDVRPRESRSPTEYGPGEAERLRHRSQERGLQQPPYDLPPHALVDSRTEKYGEDYPQPSRYIGVPDRSSGYNQRPPIEPIVDAYASRATRTNYPQDSFQTPIEPARDRYREPEAPRGEPEPRPGVRPTVRARDGRRDPSPKKLGKREPGRKLASGTNSTPLGRNRYAAGEPPLPHRTAPPIRASPVQPAITSPRHEIHAHGDRERDIYERSSGAVRYPERPHQAQHDNIPRGPRRASPPRQDFGARISDPHSIPPHLGQEPRDDHYSDSKRKDSRYRSPSPRTPGDLDEPVEIRRSPNCVDAAERPRIPTSPDMSRNQSSSTFRGSGAAWDSDLCRRISDPAVMVVDHRLEKFTPPSDKLDTLRLASASSLDHAPVTLDSNERPPLPTVVHPLPQNPMLATARQSHQPADPAAAAPAGDEHSGRRRSRSRWDTPLQSSAAPSLSVETAEMERPASPITSKKALSEITPPRLRRPVCTSAAAAPDFGAMDSFSGGGSAGREDAEQQRSWEKNGPDFSIGEGEKLLLSAPAPIVRGNSLLDRLEPDLNWDRDGSRRGGRMGSTPSLRDRVSIPSKREYEDVGGSDAFDADEGNKRRRRSNHVRRRPVAKRQS